MAYNPTDWKDRAIEFPMRFTLQDNGDGTVTLVPAPGQIFEVGTPINSANMDKIEQALAATTARADGSLPKNGTEAMTGPLTLAAPAGTSQFRAGNGDGASYSVYNVLLKLWHGLGVSAYDDVVRMFFDARVGKIDAKDGFYQDGNKVYSPINKPWTQLFNTDSGYFKFAGGLILQWAKGLAVSSATNGGYTYNLPTAFPNAAFIALGFSNDANNPCSASVNTTQVTLLTGASADRTGGYLALGW